MNPQRDCASAEGCAEGAWHEQPTTGDQSALAESSHLLSQIGGHGRWSGPARDLPDNCRFSATEKPWNMLQTQQTEAGQTGAASLTRGKACRLGDPPRSLVDAGRRRQAVAMLLVVRGALAGMGKSTSDHELEASKSQRPDPRVAPSHSNSRELAIKY